MSWWRAHTPEQKEKARAAAKRRREKMAPILKQRKLAARAIQEGAEKIREVYK